MNPAHNNSNDSLSSDVSSHDAPSRDRPKARSTQPQAVLLTGFGPFLDVTNNPSWANLRQLTFHSNPDIEFHCLELPVSYNQCRDKIQTLFTELKPAIALHFGVMRERDCFRLEQLAHKECSHTPGSDGQIGSNQDFPSGPATIHTNIDWNDLTKDRPSLPLRTSTNAGRYLCNYLMYISANLAAQAEHNCLSGFVHVPPRATDGLPALATELCVDITREIIEFVLKLRFPELKPIDILQLITKTSHD